MKAKAILLLMLGFLCSNITAQINRNSTTVASSGLTVTEETVPSVIEMDAFISSQTTTNRKSSNHFSDAQNVSDLISQVQPSVYITLQGINTYGENPKNLFIDFNSLKDLDNPSVLKNNIEIAIIKINNSQELNSTIDLSRFSAYKKLKYIYFISTVNATGENFNKMIVNNNEKYSLFYKINTGEGNHN
ncbi:MAG: hypothetical protein ACI7YS_12865 [Flavobacterium sp.]